MRSLTGGTGFGHCVGSNMPVGHKFGSARTVDFGGPATGSRRRQPAQTASEEIKARVG